MNYTNRFLLQQEYPLMTGALPASKTTRFWRLFGGMLFYHILSLPGFFAVMAAVNANSIDDSLQHIQAMQSNAFIFTFACSCLGFINFIGLFTGRSVAALLQDTRQVSIKTGKVRPGLSFLKQLLVAATVTFLYYMMLFGVTTYLDLQTVRSTSFSKPQHAISLIMGSDAVFWMILLLIYIATMNQYGQSLPERMAGVIMIHIKHGRDTHLVSVEGWLHQYPNYPHDPQAITNAYYVANQALQVPNLYAAPGAYPQQTYTPQLAPYYDPAIVQPGYPQTYTAQPTPHYDPAIVQPGYPQTYTAQPTPHYDPAIVQPGNPQTYTPPPPPAPAASQTAAASQPAIAPVEISDATFQRNEIASSTVTDKPNTTWTVTANDGTAFLLTDALIIGRKPTPTPSHPNATTGTFATPDPELSKNHCCLINLGSTIKIEDLNSTNGVEIQEENGKRQTITNDYTLQNPQTAVVFIGGKELRFT